MSNQRNRPNASRKKRRKKVTSPAKPVQPPGRAKPEPLPPMTSDHIAKVLSGFMILAFNHPRFEQVYPKA